MNVVLKERLDSEQEPVLWAKKGKFSIAEKKNAVTLLVAL
jgi:hypothetical protein